MSTQSELEQLRKRFQRGELTLDEMNQEKVRLGISPAPVQPVKRDYVSSLKKVALAGGVVLAGAGVIAALTKVSAAGLDCGSVFSPEPWRGLSLDALYSESLCERALAKRSPVAWTLIVLGVLLMLASFFPSKKTAVEPAIQARREPEVKRSKSDQMDDLIELKESGALTEEQFQSAKDRILGKPAANAAQRAKLDELHESGVLSDAGYVAAVERLKGSE
ncbi:SHOCT domain-containing protein [Timonella senegalensis]|uniref:SHOCT domain-containing protein n=1 Tax=Timonella senegalensis TaxID=1465825 RepID=UPI002FDCBEDF